MTRETPAACIVGILIPSHSGRRRGTVVGRRGGVRLTRTSEVLVDELRFDEAVDVRRVRHVEARGDRGQDRPVRQVRVGRHDAVVADRPGVGDRRRDHASVKVGHHAGRCV